MNVVEGKKYRNKTITDVVVVLLHTASEPDTDNKIAVFKSIETGRVYYLELDEFKQYYEGAK